MTNTNTAASKPRLFAKLASATRGNFEGADSYKLSFLGRDGKYYSKSVVRGSVSEVTLQNFGIPNLSWEEFPSKALGRIVQLVLDPETATKVYYVNECDQVTGKVVFKAKAPKPADEGFDFKSVPMAPANAVEKGTEPLPGSIGDEEGDKMFPSHKPSEFTAKAILDHAAREANKLRFQKMSTDMQEMALRIADNFDAIKKIVSGGVK